MPRRVGLIIPSSNRMVEQEMVGGFPKDVVVHINRLRMTGANRRALSDLLPEVERACAALVDAKCEVVAFHCTANSMSEGRSGEAALRDALRRAGAPQAATTSTSVTGALCALGARSIALLTPYSQKATDEESHFFDEIGVRVAHAKGYDLGGSDAYCSTPSSFWAERGAELAPAAFEALFLSCANIQCLSVVENIESRIGRPVITSNQVVIWETLHLIGWKGQDRLPGRLFTAQA